MARNDDQLTRRKFIHYSAAGLAAASAATAGGMLSACSTQGEFLPTRTLGATGLEVSLLAFGGGSQFLLNGDGEWEAMLEGAIDLGINYFDTCSSYQWGASMSSEERFGEILTPRRSEVLIATKFESRDPDEALKEFERSLERMKTDHVDVLMVHNVVPSEDIAALESGAYAILSRCKAEGMTRFIGFSSMDSAEKSRVAIEKLDFDVALLAMNPTGYGGFITETLPAARAKNMGVLAMKVMRDIVGGETTPEELIRWALSQVGVSSALIGHHGMATLEENIRITTEIGTGVAAASMSPDEQKRIETRLAPMAGAHALCWARPDYTDGMVC